MTLERRCTLLSVLIVCAGACSLVGCGSQEPPLEALPWFLGEYVDPSHPGGAMRLNVYSDGRFTLTQCEDWEEESGAAPTEVARGSWTSLGDGVSYTGTAGAQRSCPTR